jgi:PAS domain S-box-containing protein
MDRINRAMQRSNDVELMTSGVMQEALEIFACDRASLIYPCDPDTPTFRTVMEHTSAEYDGVLTLGQDRPTTPDGAQVLRRALDHPGAVIDPNLAAARQTFRIASLLAIAVRPKGDRPYLFVVHCSRSRPWTAPELRLFEETARRLGDALTSVLAHRNLLASQEALQALSRDLQESKAKLEEAESIAHVGYWEWDLLTSRVNWSDETYRIYGLQPQERPMDIAACQEKIHPEDWQRGMKDALGGDRFSAECRLFRPTGEVRIAHFQGDVNRDASGKPYRMFGTVEDITDRKHAEDERREHLWFLESMDRVNRAMQRTNDAEDMMSGVLDETLAIFGCDRAWLVYPCDPDAATSRVVMEHTRPEYPGAFALDEEFPVDAQGAEVMRRVLDGPGAVTDLSVSPEILERFSIHSVVAIAVRPKGDRPYLFGLHQCSHARAWTAAERRLFEEIARRLEDALTSVLAHRNLLAREEELSRSQAYLAEAQKVSHTGSWSFNADGFGHWSPELFKIHGFDPGRKAPTIPEYLGLVHPEDRDLVAHEIEKMLAGAERFDFKKRIVRPDGAIRHVRCVGIRATISGIAQEFVGTGMDVTEQVRSEEELRNAREKLAQASKIASFAELSASIAHEINQPLQAIVANGHASLRWLDATPPDIKKAIRTAKRMVRDGNAAAEVVSRIRALFKHAAPAKVDLDINKLIVQVRTLMADEIQGNGVSVKTELGKDVPRIRADAVQIQQVIVNLVRNAIEAMVGAPRKPLLIRSRRSAGHVAVDVRDQGAGLVDPEKIFEPFVSTKETGMGMGLTICRSIIEAHAGDIRVVHNDGPGVTFSFSLPIDASEAT